MQAMTWEDLFVTRYRASPSSRAEQAEPADRSARGDVYDRACGKR